MTMAPLTPLRVLPMPSSNSHLPSPSSQQPSSSPSTKLTLSFKRPSPPTVALDHKRKKPRKSPLSETTIPTPETAFKIPALPSRVHRALTPSTSTVAASSSPPRLTSSSPTRGESSSAAPMDQVTIVPGTSLIFGRHRHRLPSPTPSDPSSSKSQSTVPVSSPISLRSAVPNHLHHLVSDLDAPTSIIYLSRYASHASRTHALVEYDEERDVLRVLVIGQNGMRIAGKRALAGQRKTVSRTESVTMDFYGTSVAVSFPPVNPPADAAPQPQSAQAVSPPAPVEAPQDVEDRHELLRAQLFTPELSSPIGSARMSLPPSSPPMMPLSDGDVEMQDDEAEEEHAADTKSPLMSRAVSPIFSRESSPLSVPSDEEEESAPSSEPASEPAYDEEEAEEESQEEEEEQARGLTPPPRSVSREKSIKRELIDSAIAPLPNIEHDPIPSGVDLPALLASTVVFSGSSKLSLPDLVKHMLDSQPSLRETGEESRWMNWAGEVLEKNPMFGKVQRHGKDASGHPLLPHYFYNPANDPDTSRAAELGGLVRPLRTVQRAGGKAIDWRPVGSGRRRY